MKGLIGCPAQIVTAIPHPRQMPRLSTTELSTKAKFRLEVFDWYYQKSARCSKSGLPAGRLHDPSKFQHIWEYPFQFWRECPIHSEYGQ